MARKYSNDASNDVEKIIQEHKHVEKFKTREQAIAVGLSKARQIGKKVPDK